PGDYRPAPLPGFDATRRIDLDHGNGRSVKRGRIRAQRLTVAEGATARHGMELVAGGQVLDITEPHVLKSVTLRGGEHDRIVWQSHFGVEAAVQRIDQDQLVAPEVPLAQFL